MVVVIVVVPTLPSALEGEAVLRRRGRGEESGKTGWARRDASISLSEKATGTSRWSSEVRIRLPVQGMWSSPGWGAKIPQAEGNLSLY